MAENIPFNGIATMIGSMPHTSSEAACRLILDLFPEMPAWPQLPQRCFYENMYVQYSEGMPCLVVDKEHEKVYFDTEHNDVFQELEQFYGQYLGKQYDSFMMSRAYAAGLYNMLDMLGKKQEGKDVAVRFVKGQITGPISFGLTVTDQHKRAILYNEHLLDAVVKCCAIKAQWQISVLGKCGSTVILFIDEPYLASFGSAYINLSREQVVSFLNEVMEAIGEAGGIPGIHCCANTDWSILMETKVKIVNFDAYSYFQGMTLYPQMLKDFYERGGTLAWGIIPTSEDIESESVDSLLKSLEQKMGEVARLGIPVERVRAQSLITPSCGMGSVEKERAETIVKYTREVSKRFKSSLVNT